MSLAVALLLALVSAAAFFAGGYLLGARAGQGAREALRAELVRAQDGDGAARELRAQMDGLLRPMAERERLGLELTRLDQDLATHAGLPRLLSSIASRAGFSTVLITDDAGLPLAVNEGARDAELLGASASLLLTLVDRVVQHGAPAPLGAVLRDSENKNVLHRIFRVGHERYVLTAVASGGFLPPDVLDPTLVRIERLLTAHTAQS